MLRLTAFLVFCLTLSTYAQKPYFQQQVYYTINVALDDLKHEFSAVETIRYTNNSPAALSEIYMHLWPNAYNDNTTALARQLVENGKTDFYYAPDEERGFIDKLDFRVNDQNVLWKYDTLNHDICRLILNAPLKPGETITITTPFHVKIPASGFSRLGHKGQSYQVTQWYPKPAVYDLNGWNAMPYLDQGEFYSEYGSFNVSITLPKNYVVGATGNLMEESERNWLNEKAKETSELTSYSHEDAFPPSDSETKTISFHEDSIHDFAWFADKRFHVAKSEVTLPNSKRVVTSWALFTNSNPGLWINATNYINNTVYNYSLWNGDYPYNNVTAVDGALAAGSGMEYPGITVIGAINGALELETVIVHEVGHNWFYGILGSNERKHPWMDEGINSFYETRHMMSKHPDKNFLGEATGKAGNFLNINSISHRDVHELGYLITARRGTDQPIEYPADKLTYMNYAGVTYSKTAMAFTYLKAYLGDTLFDFCMQAYYRQWKFKHPQPQDLRITIEEASGRKLAWFFDDLIQTTKKLDYKICAVRSTKDSISITLKNSGQINGPVAVSGIKGNKEIIKSWSRGFDNKHTISFPANDYDFFRIDHDHNAPELSRMNNTIRTNGLFKKIEPISLKFLAGVEQPYKTQVFYTPILGWNNYNKTMLGMAFYNSLVPSKPLEFVVAPMYSFGTKNITGSGNLNYTFKSTTSFIQKSEVGSTFSRYAYASSPILNYNRMMPYLKFTFRKKDGRSPIAKNLLIRNISMNLQEEKYYGSSFPYVRRIESAYYYINEVAYEAEKKTALHASSVLTTFQQGKGFVKTFLESNAFIAYKGKNRGFDLRVFAGAFLLNQHNTPGPSFKMNSWTGAQDYTFDQIYLGRTDRQGLWAQQIAVKEGGFKVPTIIGSSSTWLVALNLKTSLPGRLPIRFFADIGMSPRPGTKGDAIILYDGGFELTVIHNILSVYFPLFMSKDIEDVLIVNDKKFLQTIRFELNLTKLNPFTFIKNFTL